MNQQIATRFQMLANNVAFQALPKHIHDQLAAEIQSLHNFVQQQDAEKSKAMSSFIEQMKKNSVDTPTEKQS